MDFPSFAGILAEELLLPAETIEAGQSLDELGVQSIDVVQVLQRVEIALGRELDTNSLAEVETVEQFYRALVGPVPVEAPAPAVDAAATAPAESGRQAEVTAWLGTDPLAGVDTLAEMVLRRAVLTPDREAFRFDDEVCTYAELAIFVERVARALRRAGVSGGDVVVLMMPNCAEFLPLFHGITRLGAIVAPIFHASGPERIASIVRDCQATMVITRGRLDDAACRDLDAALEGTEVDLVALADVFTDAEAGHELEPLPVPEPDAVAMLQYTSGTTGDSKGVMLTHRGLMANIRQMIPPAQFNPDDVFVSWLPVYHDMGLITMTLCPMYVGARVVLLPVSLRPQAWFEAITEHRGTMTAAPDFAYRFALRFGGDVGKYDLTSLRFALVAAEPVRASTIEAFETAHGLRNVLRPGYGLAEICVGAAFWPLSRDGLVVDDDGFVGVGAPLTDFDVDIRQGDRSMPAGERGEVCLRSPSQTAGYYRDAELTDRLTTSDGFIRTGDVGYVDEDGVLFIVGRTKEVIIVAGRNLAPKEVEEIVDSVDGVASSMALGIDEGGKAGEHLHLFVEARAPRREWTTLAQAIGAKVKARLGLRPSRVHMVKRGTIPRTHNGKRQYATMRARYLAERAEEQAVPSSRSDA
ncbi:MAG: AMP-binding protein [Myxococcota bacterium]